MPETSKTDVYAAGWLPAVIVVYLYVMYLGIDVGGTKTLVASLDDHGVIQQQFRFLTPQHYPDFLKELTQTIKQLEAQDFHACGMGIPALIDRQHGIGIAFAHLKWHNVAVQSDVEKLVNCPVALENDAKLAGLSEAILIKDKQKVLYITVSTGIGIAYIVDHHISRELAAAEGGQMLLEHHGKYQRWEDFASGSAIYKRYNKKVSEIDDARALRVIARNIAIGLIDLLAILTPDIVVLGGSVGTHYSKYGGYLDDYLRQYDNPLISIPPIKAAERPEQAVIYGCYDYARQLHG